MPDDNESQADRAKTATANPAMGVHWTTHATFWSQIGLSIIGIFALCIYYCQLREMRKSTDASTTAANAASDGLTLNRNMLRATSAGIISPILGFTQTAGVVNVVLLNKGKGNAWDIQTNYRISLITLPTRRVIRSGIAKSVKQPVIVPGEGANNYTILPRFTREDMNCFNKQQEAVMVEGQFRYDNSFDKVDQPFCMVAMLGSSIPCADVPMQILVSSDPFGLNVPPGSPKNVPPVPPAEDCHQKR